MSLFALNSQADYKSMMCAEGLQCVAIAWMWVFEVIGSELSSDISEDFSTLTSNIIGFASDRWHAIRALNLNPD